MAVTVLLWGLNFPAVKVLYRVVDAPAVALCRTLLTALIMVPYCWAVRESLTYPKGYGFRIIAQGFVSLGVYMVLFMEGMRTAPPAVAAIILATAPILTTLAGVLAKQDKFEWRSLGGLIVSFVGAAMVLLGGAEKSEGELLGALLILLSAAVWAVGVVLVRPIMAVASPTRIFTLSMPGSLLVLIPYGLVPSLHTDWTNLSIIDWLVFTHVSVLSGGVAFVTYYLAVNRLGAARTGFYQYFIPPLAAFSSWLVLDAKLHPIQLLGLAVVLAGVIAGTRRPPAAKK